ncbi:hypothetical protein PGT21_036379 [Puccinia graminis f. sp. tritici]|uniref:Uncharacterized protein n=1 Tax=Puccinia graminis f. sp. tritici TaxID=56615 RepID=A0A5B0MJP1_PUCGR|nr:hypothetical protein PGTUg99_037552 [Puccinia graminis f. sp. tritici]KAA1091630.1 hypothetical protein PGT21_036379 [Puccinia graminis f. sp. tritici]
MSQPLNFNQISNTNNNNNNNNELPTTTINFDQLPISDPAAVYSATSLELGFHPIHLFKFALLLLAFLVIPILSTNNLFPRALGQGSRKSSPKHSHRRRRQPRRQLPANYQPPQSVVDAPFIPLPTRRHFRISHVGNQRAGRLTTGSVVYTNHSSSESDEYCSSEDAHHAEPLDHFRLVFGKRLRGEEEEFRGPSVLKGSPLSARAQPTQLLTLHSQYSQANSTARSESLVDQPNKPLPHKKSISFAATTQACTHRISTQIDSSLSFLSCQLK